MFHSEGFLGTSAPFYLDLATTYFAILPFLLAFSIYFAVKKEYKKHFISQAIILGITLTIVIIFEIGVRISGGFLEYSKYSNISFDFMLVFLGIHIQIAIIAVAGWLFLFISSYKDYKNNKLDVIKHKKIGKAIFTALTISSIMGVCIYLFLFVF
jgi:putative membrane protein